MAYWAEGIVAKREVLVRHRGRFALDKVASLAQGFGFMPVVDLTWDYVSTRLTRALLGSESGEPERYDAQHDLTKLCWALDEWLAEMSLDGPVAVVQISCHGGDCEHGAAVWRDGQRSHAPAVMESHHSAFDNPVNQALRLIGVDPSGHYDAFVAVGLPERRSREDWEAAAV